MPGKRQRKPLVKPVRRKPEPVTVGKLPMFRCSLCKQKIFFDPRKTTAAKVMAKHYKDEHALDARES